MKPLIRDEPDDLEYPWVKRYNELVSGGSL